MQPEGWVFRQNCKSAFKRLLIGFYSPQRLCKGHAILSKILSLNMVSSYFSPQVWSQRVRQPVFLATAVSIGLHGVIFAAMPFLGQGTSELEEPESVGVVALSAEDMARLPDFAQNDALNLDNFGNPLVTQDGLSPLDVPEPPPLGDLGADFDFSDPLSATNLGPPLDLLPPIPVDGGFDASGFDDSGFDDSSFFVSSDPLPAPDVGVPPLEIAPPSNDLGLNTPLELEEDFAEPEVDLDPMSPATQFDGELPGDSETFQDNGPVAINSPLPQEGQVPADFEIPVEGADEQLPLDDTPPPPPPATLNTAEQDLLAMRDQMRALNRKYASDGSVAMAPEEQFQRLQELIDAVPAQSKTRQFLEIPLPDDFPRCADEVRSGVFSVLVPETGGAPSVVNVVEGTGVSALDEIAIAQINSRSDFDGGIDDSTGEEQPVQARYVMQVTFTDSSAKCNGA